MNYKNRTITLTLGSLLLSNLANASPATTRKIFCQDPFGVTKKTRILTITTSDLPTPKLAAPLTMQDAIRQANGTWVLSKAETFTTVDVNATSAYPILGKGVVITGGWVRAIENGTGNELVVPLKLINDVTQESAWIQESQRMPEPNVFKIYAWDCINPQIQN